MASQYFETIEHLASSACIVDFTQPTFGGIVSVTPNNNGTFTIAWAAGSTTKTPLRYAIYCAIGNVSAATLFSLSSNIIQIEPSHVTSTKVLTLPDNSTYFVTGQEYTFGVRAFDALGVESSNLQILNSTAIATGDVISVLQAVAVSLSADHVNFQTDHSNFQSDHTNFQADHANFLDDHSNFLGDHSNFVDDHGDFQNDHSNFLDDHGNFQTDHSNLQDDHSNFVDDHGNFQTDHADFQIDHANFQADHANFEDDHANFQTDRNFVTDITGYIPGDSDVGIVGTVYESDVVIEAIVYEED